MKPRINPDWQALEAGEAVVSDWMLDGQERFIPFIYSPVGFTGEPERTRIPWGGGLLRADLCWPYGALSDRCYADLRKNK
jgi:hypothetical protein